jgi:hypothetical protein
MLESGRKLQERKKVQDALEWTAIPFGTTQSNQLKWSADDEQSIEGV